MNVDCFTSMPFTFFSAMIPDATASNLDKDWPTLLVPNLVWQHLASGAMLTHTLILNPPSRAFL